MEKRIMKKICTLGIVSLFMIGSFLGVVNPVIKNSSANSWGWTNMDPTVRPSARYNHAMAYDSESDKVILFGGCVKESLKGVTALVPCFHSNETWAYDYNTNNWTYMNPSMPLGVNPSARENHAMAYDSESDRVILFGGSPSSIPGADKTWAYDYNNNTWTNMNPTGNPSARRGHAMAYESQNDRVILFGGFTLTGAKYSQETWEYDFNSNRWNILNPTPPSGRMDHAMTYDGPYGNVTLFGGFDGSTRLSDTWIYDYDTNTWTDMKPTTKPAARREHAMSWDSQSGRAILFGGWTGDVDDETWAYYWNTNTWTDMDPDAEPSACYGHAMAYDSESDRVILYGGATGSFFPFGFPFSDETWSYHHPNP